MEVYPRSSWFLLLLGFTLVAYTLQESSDCPKPEDVSCTSGTKCNVNEDCQSKEICCSNACYTKRCVSVTKGEADGPTETDCRPYIEKALKELEIGEGGLVQKELPKDKDESVEDIPTVEITDDSSRQEEDDGGAAAASHETDGEDDGSVEQVQPEAVQGSTPEDEKEEDSGETPDEKEVEQSDEKDDEQDEEETNPQSVEEPAEQVEESVEQVEVQQEAASQETSENLDEPVQVLRQETPDIAIEEAPIQMAASPEEASIEQPQTASAEEQEQSEEVEKDTTQEAESDEAKETETAQSEEQSAEAVAESKEEEPIEEEKSAEEAATEKVASAETEGTEATEESAEEDGCPSPAEVSCTEGDLCSKHRHCGDDQICCPNKCYRKRCTQGSVSQQERDAESESVESTEAQSEEQQFRRPETGCPPANEVSCAGGELCSKHRQCGEDQICCPNKCYRRRCIPGTATSEELAAESEESVEDSKEVESAEKVVEVRTESGCPDPSEVSCKEGAFCSKHKHCSTNEICCPNKCYRKRCTPGTPTDAELAAESELEDSEEEEAPKLVVPRKDVGCPDRSDIPCGGEKCGKNRHCSTGEICCANKCYRKVCVEGTPDSQEQEDESTEEDKQESAEALAESEEEEGCPSPEKVSCKEGQMCGNDDDCSSEEICCPNKCYNKRCIPGKKDAASAEEAEPIKPVKAAEAKKVEKKEEEKPKLVTVPVSPSVPVKKREEREIKRPEVKKSEEKKEKVKATFRPISVVEPEIPPETEEDESLEKGAEAPVEELSQDTDIPTDLRSRDHVEHLLKLDQESKNLEAVQNRVYESTLKELKRLYENAIKPLEVLYKYRDLSNRHFGDAEIFSKPLVLFMGPWSGGKSSIINYLINNEYNETSLRTGAEPSPAYFNILMHGEEPEIIDGTELAADFTFSGLQKFGQGLEERLRGVKLPSKLLEKVNIVEIPGILEVRKQVSRVFPFNDACQWFIDRADIIFLVYDPSKLDVGPETEAILDQLKGREHQTRILLNKADQVKPEELMRVQGALIWNISPLMSSPQPPVMYTTSLWSRPYEPWAPARLLQSQERAFLRDLKTAIDRRVENKIASARRFAVRVRNHAKMVDCYLTTYYNHKSVFGNRKQVANEIIEHPQDYHIYEGLSTLTNISRYDLPDPEVYRDFFKLNPLYEFQQLSATCTYFRGCPINRLDIAIAYDLPELVGTYKRNLEEAIEMAKNPPKETEPAPKKAKKSAPGS
ncbi:AT-rich interactive domain-containing protein 4B [Anthonomus grandis grandis]|uniref:AT-rich interactive domain-containing protein 4B n=1 Tax=Anthonomus grandis grandis TaxID=2921223 RepID=UPI002165FE34|nr:AT-rich interactive domain-containing protein 4B [Anthonomus grandis grandis]